MYLSFWLALLSRYLHTRTGGYSSFNSSVTIRIYHAADVYRSLRMSGAGTADVDVDLGRLFGSLSRNWRRIAVVAAGTTAIAFMLASMATPHYRAETRVLIENRESIY